MNDQPRNIRSFVNAMFEDEPAGTFLEGYVFKTAPDLDAARLDPSNGYWHCDIRHDNNLTWSDQIYELFGLPAGTPVEREWAVARYSDASRSMLEHVRSYGLNRSLGFILDAEIRPEGEDSRWIRVLATPIFARGRIVGLHGVKRAL
jgi:hypothetical protein